MGALKTEPSLASVGEGRQKKPFLFSVVSLSLSLSLSFLLDSLCRSIVPLLPPSPSRVRYFFLATSRLHPSTNFKLAERIRGC